MFFLPYNNVQANYHLQWPTENNIISFANGHSLKHNNNNNIIIIEYLWQKQQTLNKTKIKILQKFY